MNTHTIEEREVNGWQAAWVRECREAASAAGGPPARKRGGGQGGGRREALGQDADLKECDLANQVGPFLLSEEGRS